MREQIEKRLLRRSTETPDGCRTWDGARNQAGYGRISYGGKTRYTHRVSYAVNVGPLPKGFLVRHTCDNPSCLNPDHLVLGDHCSNARDSVARGRHYFSRLAATDRGE